MILFIGLFSFLTCIFSPLKAAVQTDTHTYILCTTECLVLAINRHTGEEKRIPVGSHPQDIILYKDMGFVVNWGSDSVSILDLKRNTITQTINVGRGPKAMTIYNDKGYVVCGHADIIEVVDLTSLTITKKIPVGELPQRLELYNGKGYVVNNDSDTVSVIDLEKEVETQTIPVGDDPVGIIFYDQTGYVLNDKSLSIIDLERNVVKKTIKLDTNPRNIVQHNDVAYLVDHFNSILSVFDLKTNTVVQKIKVKTASVCTNSMIIRQDTGYVFNRIFDLKTNKVIGTINNPNKREIDISDTHIYLGVKKGPLIYQSPEKWRAYFNQQLKDRPIAVYKDALSPQEILTFLVAQSTEAAFDLVFGLYDPIGFLQSPCGDAYLNYLARW